MLTIPTRAEVRSRPPSTPRLALLPLGPTDGADLWPAVNASRAWLAPWLPWVPFQTDPEASVRFAEASAADWDAGRAVRFAIRDRPGGALLGVVGLEVCIHMHRSCDLGYWLCQDATGKGFMTEAARLCVDFGFRRLGVHRLRVAAATHNHPSLRVISRVGFRFEGVARHAEWCDGRWLDHAVFSLLESEWSSS